MGSSFAVLFALAGPESMDFMALGNRLGLPEGELRRIVDDLQREYLVDVVSRLDGESVKETLDLTEEGEAFLLRSLEQVYELPEPLRY